MAVNLSMIFSRSIMTVKPHVPMIQFRKGGSPQKHSEAGHSSSPQVVQAASQAKSASGRVVSRPLIEDYQLPARYRRHVLDQAEIDAINILQQLTARHPTGLMLAHFSGLLSIARLDPFIFDPSLVQVNKLNDLATNTAN